MARSNKPTSLAEPTKIKMPRAKKGSGKWPCIFVDCPARLSRKADVMRHVDIHSNLTIYKHPCNDCMYSARQKGNLNAHFRRRHVNPKGNRNSGPLCRPRSPSKREMPKSKDEDERLTATVANIDRSLLHPAYAPLAEESSSTSSYSSHPHTTASGFSTNTTPRSVYSESLPPSPKPTCTLETPTSAPFTSALARSTPLCTVPSTCARTYGSATVSSGSLINPPPLPPILLPIPFGPRFGPLIPRNSNEPTLPSRAHSYHREYSHGGYVAYQVPTPPYHYPISRSSATSHDSFYYPHNPYPTRPAPYPPRPAPANCYYEVSHEVGYLLA
ncbi:hypothetical protein BJ912DRAFT_974182 [Pholiota molesta]|nr:hypothetical protein BJ912DRAFT_974182 [Pholiota molesta]